MDARYMPPDAAVTTLRLRREQQTLAVDDALRSRLASGSYAILFRAIATPNFEMLRFVALARQHGLAPLILEHHSDKLVFSRNPLKHALARMRFHDGFGRNGGARLTVLPVCDMSVFNGRTIADVKAFSGESLVGFHHHLLRATPETQSVEYFDLSSWLIGHGGAASSYYQHFLSLFVCHAVLFETFLATPTESQFVSEVVIPAFEAVASLHGCRPLISRLDPLDAEGDSYWLQYPQSLHVSAASRLSSSTLFPNEPNG